MIRQLLFREKALRNIAEGLSGGSCLQLIPRTLASGRRKQVALFYAAGDTRQATDEDDGRHFQFWQVSLRYYYTQYCL